MSLKWIRAQEPVTFAAAVLVVVVAELLPLALLGWELATASSNAPALLSSGALWELFLRTLTRASAITVLAVALGLPLGFLLGRTDVIGRRLALAFHAFPMFLPPFLLALGWFYLFGRQGFMGSEVSSRLLFGEPGAVAIQALAFAPVVTALVMLGLDGIDPTLEDAGRAVTSSFRVTTRISLPLIWPSLALAALIVLALSLAELGVPMFLRVKAYPALVFARLGGAAYNPGEAFGLTVPLAGVALLLLALERRVAARPSAMAGVRPKRPSLCLGRARIPLTLACWTVAVLSGAPLAGLVLRAAGGGGFAQAPGWLGRSLWNSMLAAAVAATVIAAVGAVVGWALARVRRGARALDALMALSFMMPAAVLGVGLIAVWNRPATGFLYSSAAILVIGYVARYSVIGARPIAAAIAQSSVSLEDAAAALGAGFLRRFSRIVLPIHRRAIAWAWLLALVFCLRDLETAVLYYPPGGETLPVRIFTLEANGPEPVVAALALLHVGVTALALGAGAMLLQRRR